ncbi:hypothetical protein VTN96DRAFT_7414 [Rasamsonia emersonii]
MATAIPFPPPPSSDPHVYVTISALEGGHLTLPEKLFVTDADPDKRSTVPSLSFLIQHPNKQNENQNQNQKSGFDKIVFDLGIKRDLSAYHPAMHSHIANRQPVLTRPDVADSLRQGGLDPASDIDYVILSHVHWDHVGTPGDFLQATFVLGPGTLRLLEQGAPPHYPKEIFDSGMLPRERVWEMPCTSSPGSTSSKEDGYVGDKARAFQGREWRPLCTSSNDSGNEILFPAVIDLFNDSSLYLIDSPGHLYGHMNLLARIGPTKWVYLGGDCCHDPRILTGEKDIALYDDGRGGLRSVHVDTDGARRTLERIRRFTNNQRGGLDGSVEIEIEVIVAHDAVWRERNRHRFFPKRL